MNTVFLYLTFSSQVENTPVDIVGVLKKKPKQDFESLNILVAEIFDTPLKPLKTKIIKVLFLRLRSPWDFGSTVCDDILLTSYACTPLGITVFYIIYL